MVKTSIIMKNTIKYLTIKIHKTIKKMITTDETTRNRMILIKKIMQKIRIYSSRKNNKDVITKTNDSIKIKSIIIKEETNKKTLCCNKKTQKLLPQIHKLLQYRIHLLLSLKKSKKQSIQQKLRKRQKINRQNQPERELQEGPRKLRSLKLQKL